MATEPDAEGTGVTVGSTTVTGGYGVAIGVRGMRPVSVGNAGADSTGRIGGNGSNNGVGTGNPDNDGGGNGSLCPEASSAAVADNTKTQLNRFNESMVRPPARAFARPPGAALVFPRSQHSHPRTSIWNRVHEA